ncbi:MAG: NADPH-dependent glutamate synthase [Fervidicoccaceae archaeon]
MRLRVPVPKRDPLERSRDFAEVSLGYDEREAVAEASRCIQCPSRPCVSGCPIGVDVPRFVKLLAERKFSEAYRVLTDRCPVPAITGRVCPQERQCEALCTLAKLDQPIAIGALERFLGDWAYENGLERPKRVDAVRGKSVAVVGSGAAGIIVASDLARLGYEIVLYEALHAPGGVMVYGIPEFRLPKRVVEAELRYLDELGAEVLLGAVVGKTFTVDELLDQHDAVFLGTGAGRPRLLGVPGEELNGIYTANEFLVRVNLMRSYLFPEYDTPLKVGSRVAVIGAGNTAMDAARTAVRMGAREVWVLYRRTRAEMPARLEEVRNAEEEGVKFVFLVRPVAFRGSFSVESVVLEKMKLGEPDESGRPRPLPTGELIEFEVDTVINAIGFHPNPLVPSVTPGLKTLPDGRIYVDSSCRTSLPRVYAGGDVVVGEGTVIEAMGWGRRAAKSIHEDLARS